jgi:HD superfamily phosphohydrolase
MADYKIIHDTVHGSIKLDGLFLELLETPEIQRLHGIHQLGLAYLVFPGANHTRLEHSIGTCHVAGRLADALGLDEGEKRLVMAAGMLHDIGHAPYSHTLEIAMHDKTKLDHMDITKDIILGKRGIKLDGGEEGRIPNLLEKYEVVPKEVAGLISGLNPDESVKTLKDFSTHEDQVFFNDKKYLDHIIHGTIDSDQIDYLLRDSHYTGVAHGTIDMDRLIQTVELFNNDLVVNRRGVPAVEGMLVARALMFTSVYFHKTVRMADLMLAKAVEQMDVPLDDLHTMIDSDLMALLIKQGGFQKEIAQMLKFRKLYKRALFILKDKITEEEKKAIEELKDPQARKKAELEICRRADIPEGFVIVDVPGRDLLVTEPRIKATNVKILDDNRLKPLSRFSPLAKALEIRDVHDWEVMVCAAPKYLDRAEKVTRKVLFG